MTNTQSELWNGVSGRAWADSQPLLDRLFEPFVNILLDPLPRGSRILDVGCGAGALTLAAAERGHHATGIDISQPLITAARERCDAEFLCADAESYEFASTNFDTIVSRFGVMFFNDPVRAFANLRRASAPDAALRLLAWRGADENPFMTTAERAAADIMVTEPRHADGPGQFAFADPQQVRQILRESGWGDVTVEPVDVPCAMPQGDLLPYVTRLGPLGKILPQIEEPQRSVVVEAVRKAFDPYVANGQVRFAAACWLVHNR